MAVHYIPDCPICGSELTRIVDRTFVDRVRMFRWLCDRCGYRTPWARSIEELDRFMDAVRRK